MKNALHQQSCLGVVIDKKFVLTAAHCVDDLGPNPPLLIGITSIDDTRRTPGVLVSDLRYNNGSMPLSSVVLYL